MGNILSICMNKEAEDDQIISRDHTAVLSFNNFDKFQSSRPINIIQNQNNVFQIYKYTHHLIFWH